jgi:hypothetical protein
VPLWRLTLQEYLQWFEAESGGARTEASLAKDASHLRGLLEYAWRSGRSERNVLDGLNLHQRVKGLYRQPSTTDGPEGSWARGGDSRGRSGSRRLASRRVKIDSIR